MSQIYVIHENEAWVEPLRAAFEELKLPWEEWFLESGVVDLQAQPPDGVFYNRMSASSHTRGHRYAPEYAGAVISWLERHGRRVINSGRALQLEVSKVAQYAELHAHGIRTPNTLAVVGRDEILGAGRRFPTPLITKHNRAGKGLGVRLFREYSALEAYVRAEEFDPPIDGITLLQQYIEASEPFITRVEFVGGRFLYAVRVDTTQGFELCPAEACRVDDAFCPVGETSASHDTDTPMFQILTEFGSERVAGIEAELARSLIERYERLLADNAIHIAGIEFILDRNGTPFTYDINTNTNYNPDAEARAGIYGMRAVAAYLGRELSALPPPRRPMTDVSSTATAEAVRS